MKPDADERDDAQSTARNLAILFLGLALIACATILAAMAGEDSITWPFCMGVAGVALVQTVKAAASLLNKL